MTPIKTFLGKYYSELNYSALQEKYENTSLDTFFEQRFKVQDNKIQMIVDASLSGLSVVFSGNEISISKRLYEHPSILISNSLENSQSGNPKSLYNPEIFSTISYLICQNHTMFRVVDDIDEPIYVVYKSDYETFYNSVVIFETLETISVEIIEEIESHSALNVVANYIMKPTSNIKLTSFYHNHLSAISFIFRNIIAHESCNFEHMLYGKGSSNIIDENKIFSYTGSNARFNGIVNSNAQNFHSILYIQPMDDSYSVNVDYRNIVEGNADITFFPAILEQEASEKSSILVSSMDLDDIEEDLQKEEIEKYLSDIISNTEVTGSVGSKRFHDNKHKFLSFYHDKK